MNRIAYQNWPVIRLHTQQSVLNHLFSPLDGYEQTSAALRCKAWAPPIDIHEEAQRYVLQLDVPGVEAKDIEITLESGVLTIKGRRTHNVSESDNGTRYLERRQGDFLRRVNVPQTRVVSDDITADCHNGVLQVVIPKQQVLPKRIQVN